MILTGRKPKHDLDWLNEENYFSKSYFRILSVDQTKNGTNNTSTGPPLMASGDHLKGMECYSFLYNAATCIGEFVVQNYSNNREASLHAIWWSSTMVPSSMASLALDSSRGHNSLPRIKECLRKLIGGYQSNCSSPPVVFYKARAVL